MVVGDRLGDVLEHHRLADARRRDDQRALALALRADDIDDARRAILDGRILRIERQFALGIKRRQRSEEHTSELQSLMRISYAVFCLTKKKIILVTLNNINS